MDLTIDYLRSILKYDQKTGDWSWLVFRGPCTPGKEAGWVDEEGYRYIMVDGQNYAAHRLAFFYVTGSWPPDDIDHVRGISSGDNFSNLRPATKSQNQGNRGKQKNNTSGYKGVFWHKGAKKWMVMIANKYIGLFDDPEKASEAYAHAAKAKWGEFSRIE